MYEYQNYNEDWFGSSAYWPDWSEVLLQRKKARSQWLNSLRNSRGNRRKEK